MRSVSAPSAVSKMTGTWPRSRKRATHGETVEPRQHDVEHHEIGHDLRGQLEGDQSVGGQGDVITLTSQVAGHDVADGRVVIDDQNPTGRRLVGVRP